MHTRWLRASRSAARRVPACRTHLESRPHRAFSASTSFRRTSATGAADTPNPSSNGDGNKPGKGDGVEGASTDPAPQEPRTVQDNATTADNVSEAIEGSGSTTTTTTTTDDAKAAVDGQGRKKRTSTASLRSRLLRSRTAQEMPPIELPKTFLEHAITRAGDLQRKYQPAHPQELALIESHAAEQLRERVKSRRRNMREESLPAFIIESNGWDEALVERALAEIAEGSTDRIRRRGDLLVAAAYWRLAGILHAMGETDKVAEATSGKLLQSIPSAAGLELVRYHCGKGRLDHDVIEDSIDSDYGDSRTVAAIEHSSFEELLAAMRSDLEIKPPPKAKSISSLQRPATVARFDFTTGSMMPKDVISYAARSLEADLLYLSPQSLASTLGNYLGQDIVRAPSMLTQLGFRAALNAGRVKPKKVEETEDDESGLAGLPKTFTIMLGQDNKKKGGSKSSPLAMMDQYLNGSNGQDKSDERWEDLKLNTALEEIVHTALPEDATRPLVVHVHDFVTLGMDSESGNALLAKLRKIVDNLWLDGRKVILVGTCSTKGVPSSYLDALASTTLSERVLNVVSLAYTMQSEADLKLGPGDLWPPTDLADFWVENIDNLANVLASLVPEYAEALRQIPVPLKRDPLGPVDIYWRLEEDWTTGVLSLPEIYRVATAVIGTSLRSEQITSINHWHNMVFLIRANNLATERQTAALKRHFRAHERATQADGGGSGAGGIFAAMGKVANPSGSENYEERLLSGLIQPKDIRTTFADVHAPRETIESIQILTTLSLLKPEAFSYGVLATDRIPGCLLYGPPGTGKTLLAKAVAKESGASMIEVSGASINNMYVGESEKNVRALFQLAKKKSPAVIFIDEADALLGTRGRDRGSRRETLNQFLREWDGMDDSTKAFIMVATNRPFDLDEAVLRRLPRRLLIDLPTEKDRAAILRIHLKGEECDGTVNLEKLAKQTPLYSGSDLKNLCVAAAMAAVREELEGIGLLSRLGGQSSSSASASSASSSSPSSSPSATVDAEPSSSTTASTTTDPAEPKRRVLNKRHFDKALKEISASMSDDMATLTAIKKFDEKYGDGMKRKPKRGMGFDIVAPGGADGKGGEDVNEGRVRRI